MRRAQKETTQRTIHLPVELDRWLESTAQADERTVSNMLSVLLSRQRRDMKPQEQVARASN